MSTWLVLRGDSDDGPFANISAGVFSYILQELGIPKHQIAHLGNSHIN
jgi:hypothetical protein